MLRQLQEADDRYKGIRESSYFKTKGNCEIGLKKAKFELQKFKINPRSIKIYIIITDN